MLSALSRFGDHPDRIQELRKVIVGLAIAGRLHGDDALRTPAELIEDIDHKKAQLFADRQIPKPKRYPAITDEQLPEQFVDPSFFVPLGAVARIEKGLTGIQQAHPGCFPLVVTAAQRSTCDHFDFEGAAAIIPLVSSTGHGHASIHRLHYQDGQFALGTILVAVMPFAPELISARFLFEYLSTFKEELLVTRMTGTANVTLSIGKIAEIPIPLVCPTVQRKVDELMALCDQLETAQAERETGRGKFTASTLAKLNEPDPETFASDARFALEHLEPLTKGKDQVKQLRQTILNLAVRGKLVEQDAGDGPAAALFQRVQSEKARMAKAGIIPRPKESARDPDFLADALPTSWLPIALGDVCSLVTSGSRGWGEYYAETGPGFVRAQNIRFGKLRLDGLACVNPPAKSEGARTQVAKGDLFIVITGAGVTNPALLDVDLGEAYVSQHVGLVRPCDTELSPWLLLCLMADAGGRAELTMRAYGAGKPGLNLDNIRSLSVPLPPLAEQHRVVAKVDELIALCEQLETSLVEGEQTRSKLLEAVLHQALQPA